MRLDPVVFRQPLAARQEVWSALHTDEVWSAATHMARAGRQLAYQGLLTHKYEKSWLIIGGKG